MNTWPSVLLGLFISTTALHGLPHYAGTDIITPDENVLVYVFSIYAVRNVKSEVVAKMLSHKSVDRLPSIFEPIGSILVADDESEPFTLLEFADFLEDYGILVEKIDDENNPKVIEVKFDDFIDDPNYFPSVDDIVKFLQAEGIIITISQDGDMRELQVEFDKSIKNPTDQPFTLEELANFFEDEGFTVEVKLFNNDVNSIKIKIDSFSEENNEENIELTSTTIRIDENAIEKSKDRRPHSNIAHEIEQGYERKIEHKMEHDDDRIIPLNFVTRSDSSNKTRRQRSTCPECKAGNLIKQLINNYSEAH